MLGANSEVGALRTVLLHRPGAELRRLTPRNNDQLLFDGMPWVDRAQDEHDAFAALLRERGVEVLLPRGPARRGAAVPGAPDARASRPRSTTRRLGRHAARRTSRRTCAALAPGATWPTS